MKPMKKKTQISQLIIALISRVDKIKIEMVIPELI